MDETSGASEDPVEHARVVERAIELLLQVAEHPGHLSLQNLVERAGYSKSTVHRLLARLERLKVVERHPQSRRYHVGARLRGIIRASWSEPDVRVVARPILEALRDQSTETVSLHLRDGADQVVIDMCEGIQEVRWVAMVGRRSSLLTGPTARVILAFLPPEQSEALLEQIRKPQEPGPSAKSLAETREAGFAVGTTALSGDTTAITAPVFQRGGRVWGGISIAGPAFRFGPDEARRHALELMRAATEISAALGHAPVCRSDEPPPQHAQGDCTSDSSMSTPVRRSTHGSVRE